jgi:dolichol-phosphate mannosyltransferase
MSLISVVVPMLNEESIIFELVKRVKHNLELITENYEIILIDDGSIDETWSKICLMSQKNHRVKGLKFSKNFGHHFAITAGIEFAKGEWVVVMDGDLQDRPETIPDLYNKAIEGFDVVFVSRINRQTGLIYQIFQKIFYYLLQLFSGTDFDSKQANFSIISRKVAKSFLQFKEHSRFYGTTIKWLGYGRTTIFAEQDKRFAGKPSYSLRKRINLASDIIISSTDRPLKISIIVGIFISLSALLTAIWILVASLKWGYLVTGWASIMISIYFLSGIILTILGVVGSYIARIFQEVKNRPLYLIEDVIDLEKL